MFKFYKFFFYNYFYKIYFSWFIMNTNLKAYSHLYMNNPYFFGIICFIFLFIVYFTIIRPNQNRIIKHRNFIKNIKIGDEIITNGGIVGKITQVINEKYVLILINKEIKITLKKNHIVSLAPKDLFKLI